LRVGAGGAAAVAVRRLDRHRGAGDRDREAVPVLIAGRVDGADRALVPVDRARRALGVRLGLGEQVDLELAARRAAVARDGVLVVALFARDDVRDAVAAHGL